jgi:hypothetical protein
VAAGPNRSMGQPRPSRIAPDNSALSRLEARTFIYQYIRISLSERLNILCRIVVCGSHSAAGPSRSMGQSQPSRIAPGDLVLSRLGARTFLSLRVGQRREAELPDELQVLLDQRERVARGLSGFFR